MIISMICLREKFIKKGTIDKGRRKGMRTRDMIVIDGAKAKEDIRGFCKRNGVTASGAAKRRGTLGALKALGNGKRAFSVRFPEELCGFGYVCMKEDAYKQLCETYMLDSGRYIIAQKKQGDDTTPEETKATAETPPDVSDDLRGILNQIILMQQEQTAILRKMLEAWEK